MFVDILIILFAISALYRGRELGFVRQICSAAGFFGGLFLGALLQPHVIDEVSGDSNKTAATLVITLGLALVFLIFGEYIGIFLKRKIIFRPANRYDNGAGSVINIAAILVSSWLIAALVLSVPSVTLQNFVKRSHIISGLNNVLPDAPGVIAQIGKLVDPNGFPQVFVGSEPAPRGKINLPSSDSLRPAVERDRASVVKLVGQGCGGIVDGSGFVAGNGFVATNAHVIAGIRSPVVQDSAGSHRGTVVYFNPNLDFAVLRVSGLSGGPLALNPDNVPSGTPAAVMGYPGGGAFSADPAAVIERITASGRNIYGRGNSQRQIYELKANVIPGNSGGPVVGQDGRVIGVVFAQSTTYEGVGYALTSQAVGPALAQAVASNQPVGTGRCAEE